ncbi:MAG: ATP-dependent helicase, partial [Lachnospirales bacterium]
MKIEDKLNMLNPMQKLAATTTEGPLLLLAGAGSGKTRVLTHRIAYLIELGVRPFNILAITFTNKAAREMKERVCAITPRGDEVWVSTFHSTCVKILRREIDKIGYSNNFSIYDSDDSNRLIKNILKDWKIDSNKFSPKFVAGEIDKQKNNLITWEEFSKNVGNDYTLKKVAQIYEEYEKRLKECNALDFNDLIMKTVHLFRTKPEILDKYQERFKYIMVDEYQDTNAGQYQLIRLLASKYKNLCVVGDDDQSIYGWRGADIHNILGFEKDFNDCSVIKLEQNYRSTDTILNVANSVIGHNISRKDKSLWTDYTGGSKITYYQADNDLSEARYICSVINRGVTEGKEYKDYAILYRNNSLSRVIEEALVKEGIPYRLFGGTRFYDRMEIRDIMSYLKILYNPNDDVSFRRIINVPKRGIGDTTVNKIAEYAEKNQMSFFMALCGVDKIDTISSATKNKVSKFANLINNLRADSLELPVSELLDEILISTGYHDMLENENTEEAKGR